MRNKSLMLLFLINLLAGLAIRLFKWNELIFVSDVLLISVLVFVLYLNYNLKDHPFFGSKKPGYWMVMIVCGLGLLWLLKSLLNL